MGRSLIVNHPRPTESFHLPHKRQNTSSSSVLDDVPRLIPGLPDEISLQILARTPRIGYLNFKAVSRSWKAAVTSFQLYNVRKELGTTEEWLYIMMNKGFDGRVLHALDPVSKTWQRLPPLPNTCLPVFIKHRSCAFAAVDGCLYMLGGVANCSSLTRVWKYDPILNRWSEANPMSVGRAYFETAVVNNKLFVVGGISVSRVGDNHISKTPLQSAEVFDPQTGLWSEIPSMPCSKAHATAFLEGSHDKVIIGLASYRGKLYVPQRFFHTPFFTVGGEVYDPETNSWVDMPTDMAKGWPTCRGTNRSVIVDGDLFAPSRGFTSEGVKVFVYNHHNGSWKVVEGYVPIHHRSSYMLTSLLRKLHVVTADDKDNIIVMRADKRDDSTASIDEGNAESVATSESYIWNMIASGNFGFGKHEGCRTLDI